MIELIKKMQQERICNKKYPCHITYRSLLARSGMSQEELSIELNKLYKEGKIEVGNTINDKWITIGISDER